MKRKIIALGIVLVVLMSWIGTVTAFSNSGGGDWQYYREITIKENSGKTLSDYQVLVELSPSNFPDNARIDGSDLRFAEDGKELSYWIEEWNSAARNAKIWVKVPSIPANGEAKIKMYYGNEKAESVSDGDAVFEFFDDFRGIGFDSAKWTVTSSSNDNGHITGTANGNNIISTSGFGNSILLEARAKPGVVNNNAYSLWFVAVTDDTNEAGMWLPYPGSDDCKTKTYTYSTKSWYMVYEPLTTTNWYQLRMYNDNSNCDYYLYDDSGNLLGSQSNIGFYHSKRISAGVRISSGSSNAKSDVYVSWIRIRKYTSVEPTISLSAEFPTKKIPSLTLTKSASPSAIQEGEPTTISIRVENTGAGDAKAVEVTDTIPTGFKIISGSKSASFDTIKPGDYRTFEYTLKATGSGKFTCDPATATYEDADGNSYSAASNSVSIQVGGEVPVGADSDGDGWSDEKEREMGTNPYSVDSDGDGLKDPEDPNPTVPEEKKTPGFEAIFAIAGLLAVAYLLRRKNERQKI
jgi:PGF-CTERM protein/uncharacterized repeat protein (TIGR01451 family)